MQLLWKQYAGLNILSGLDDLTRDEDGNTWFGELIGNQEFADGTKAVVGFTTITRSVTNLSSGRIESLETLIFEVSETSIGSYNAFSSAMNAFLINSGSGSDGSNDTDSSTNDDTTGN